MVALQRVEADPRAAYLDFNATTPVEARVADLVLELMVNEWGNAGSRTHEYGAAAKRAVDTARSEVATVVGASPEEVIFTSGATESNNLAIFGLAPEGERVGRRHIVSTQIEHKAVLEPLAALERRGFEVTLVAPTSGGWVDPDAVLDVIRPDTVLVSMMQANNETGVLQPVSDLADALSVRSDAFFHVDAAQGFGKELESLRHPRVDLISISAHKLFAPKGVGALIARRRRYKRPPLTPIIYGGGQERGLRGGTVAVPLVAGLGLASRLALDEWQDRHAACLATRAIVLSSFLSAGARIHGDPARVLPHVVNLSMPNKDSEAVMLALKGVLAVSNGSACTSQRYEASHVLVAMGMPANAIRGAVRLSWSHHPTGADWTRVQSQLTCL